MRLRQALRLGWDARTALVGAGGKTTGLFQLARDFETPVVITSTTHLGTWQAGFADRHWVVVRPEDVNRFAGQIEGVTLFSGPAGADDRLSGLDDASLEALKNTADRLGFPVLVEADGSRQKPLKAPAAHEPAIPGWVRQVVVTAGLSGLGQPLDAEHFHRPERFAAISGVEPGSLVTEEGLARVFGSREGGLKNIPPGARVSALLNQADRPELIDAGLRVANQLIGYYASILITSLSENQIWSVVEPRAGIVLAAGGASRFGSPKVLLDWQGQHLVRRAAQAAVEGGLNPVIVVAGAEAGAVRAALAGLPVQVVENTDWQAGQSTSLRAGLAALPQDIGAAVFLLGDQPFVNSGVVQALVKRHSQTLAPVVAPHAAGRRANPVLFDRVTFPDLLDLQGDTGGRAVLDRYAVESVEWKDPRLVLDIDTPEDYRRLLDEADPDD